MLGHAGIVDFRLIYQYQIKKKKKTHTYKNNNNKHWTETINMKSKLSYGTHSSVRLLNEIKILKKKKLVISMPVKYTPVTQVINYCV